MAELKPAIQKHLGQIIEARVIAGLKDKMLPPDLVAEFIKGNRACSRWARDRQGRVYAGEYR